MRENEDTDRTGAMSIGAELKEDKVRFLEENKELRHQLGDAVNENRALAVANARFEEKAIQFKKDISRLEKAETTLKTTKHYRDYGILALTVLFGLPSLFTLTGWFRIVIGVFHPCAVYSIAPLNTSPERRPVGVPRKESPDHTSDGSAAEAVV
jgi:hypothetical protein